MTPHNLLRVSGTYEYDEISLSCDYVTVYGQREIILGGPYLIR